MHRLREHSCHSDYNVHGPKNLLLIDSWLWYCLFSNYLYLVTLLNFEGVLRIYVLLLYEEQAEYHFDMFPICFKQTFTFQCIITHDLLFVLLFML
jgi:hypothetical protein